MMIRPANLDRPVFSGSIQRSTTAARFRVGQLDTRVLGSDWELVHGLKGNEGNGNVRIMLLSTDLADGELEGIALVASRIIAITCSTSNVGALLDRKRVRLIWNGRSMYFL